MEKALRLLRTGCGSVSRRQKYQAFGSLPLLGVELASGHRQEALEDSEIRLCRQRSNRQLVDPASRTASRSGPSSLPHITRYTTTSNQNIPAMPSTSRTAITSDYARARATATFTNAASPRRCQKHVSFPMRPPPRVGRRRLRGACRLILHMSFELVSTCSQAPRFAGLHDHRAHPYPVHCRANCHRVLSWSRPELIRLTAEPRACTAGRLRRGQRFGHDHGDGSS